MYKSRFTHYDLYNYNLKITQTPKISQFNALKTQFSNSGRNFKLFKNLTR